MPPIPPTAEFYAEADCDLCRAVETDVLIPLQRRGYLDFVRFTTEIPGTKGWGKWNSLCKRLGAPVTPLVLFKGRLFWLSEEEPIAPQLPRMYRRMETLAKGEEIDYGAEESW